MKRKIFWTYNEIRQHIIWISCKDRIAILTVGVSKTGDQIQIKIKMPNPSKEPPASSKAPNEDLKDMDVLCTLKIKIESLNLDHGFVKDKWPYPNQDKKAKPKLGTSSVLQSPKSRNKDMDVHCTFKFKIKSQNFGTWVK